MNRSINVREMLRLDQDSHRRYNPLTDEWVLVSPHRTQRPWQGAIEKVPVSHQPEYDPDCYLCPGNSRAGGARNPNYTGTFVFDNDFAALTPNAPAEALSEGGLLRAEGETGICRVVCFSPRHDLTLATMPFSEVETVVNLWVDQTTELASRDGLQYVQVFENRGALMGASNPHPHCQVWASAHIPNEPVKELSTQSAYAAEKHSCLLCDYLRLEEQRGDRVVFANTDFVIVVPFWAVWPFETLVLSRTHLGTLPALPPDGRRSLAETLQRLTQIYNSVFDAEFPYSAGFHQQPFDGADHPEWHLHGHFYPPLLRSATIRKFMVGFEMLGTPQRDITPEAAAQRLREIAGRI